MESDMSSFTPLNPDHPLQLAARYNDAEGEERGLQAVVEDQGLEVGPLQYVAEQRALRTVLHQSGRGDELKQTGGVHYKPVRLNDDERALHLTLSAIYLDGIMLGWRGRRIHEQEAASEH